ncbi:MAG: coproporphyrinogen dehydrogenase HemZ [Firmicutes bacterium]|nr:coproporphyrinogen dehydrogenase HemZ [Bacillota bacterium]
MPDPWGKMQGVRPVKPLYRWLDAGHSLEEALAKMQATYGVSPAKLALLREVAEFEYPFLTSLSPRAVSVYVGIPFCPTRCLYCSFPSHSLRELGQERQRFMNALLAEIEAVGRQLRQLEFNVDSVYVGGGTPTALPAKDLRQVLQALRQALPQPWQEFTVEAGRPETLTEQHIAVLVEAGVERISINPQTKHQKTLDLIGRPHSATDIEAAVVRAEGHFPTLNMDLILGLPKEGLGEVQASIDWVLGMRPENITLHMFAPKRASRFTAEQDDWWGMLPDDQLAARMVEAASQSLRQAGYHPYYLYRQRNILGGQENVGWTLPGHACRYNMIMISERQHILGLGGGAASKFLNKDGTLVAKTNPKDVRVYIERLEELIATKSQLLAVRSK